MVRISAPMVASKRPQKKPDPHRMTKCERAAAAVPKDLPIDGLSLGEMGRLAAEGTYQLTETHMMFAGYKTYITAAAMFGVAAAMLMGVVIPEEIWMMLAAIGLGSLRAAVDGK